MVVNVLIIFIVPYALSGSSGWLGLMTIVYIAIGIFFNLGIIMALYFIIRGISNKRGDRVKRIMKDIEELKQLDPQTIIREDSHSLLNGE